MSGKKRAAEGEGEGERKSWDGDEGFELFELYSVVINEIEGDHIHGQIRSVVYDGGPGHVIYEGDEGEIGVPLLLCGPEKTLLAYDEFELLFCLGKAAPQENWTKWRFDWYPRHSYFDRIITEEVKSEGFGKATITFEVISNGMESHLDVMFLGTGDKNDKYPTHVYGRIVAYHGDLLGTDRVLYQTSKEKADPVKEGGVLQLLRSAIAAPLDKLLNIDVDLWAYYDGLTSEPVLSSFMVDFEVDPEPGEADLVFQDRVKVSLTWMVPDYFS